MANRRLAIEAAEADVDVGGNMSHWTGAKLAFTDPKTYLLAFMYHCVSTLILDVVSYSPNVIRQPC